MQANHGTEFVSPPPTKCMECYKRLGFSDCKSSAHAVRLPRVEPAAASPAQKVYERHNVFAVRALSVGRTSPRHPRFKFSICGQNALSGSEPVWYPA